MVCIIDDREDVWKFAPNLITVKKYIYFQGTGDINAPPGSREAQMGRKGKALGAYTFEQNITKINSCSSWLFFVFLCLFFVLISFFDFSLLTYIYIYYFLIKTHIYLIFAHAGIYLNTVHLYIKVFVK